jgi:hypothetical protein
MLIKEFIIMIKDHDLFIGAIYECKVITLTFQEKTTLKIKIRNCIPFDYGISTREKNPIEKYHFWDLDSPDGVHNLSIPDEQIIKIDVLDEKFEPSKYVTWKPNWHIKRDWGIYS